MKSTSTQESKQPTYSAEQITPRDWSEDDIGGQGLYLGRCDTCRDLYYGSNTRTVCKQCATNPTAEQVPEHTRTGNCFLDDPYFLEPCAGHQQRRGYCRACPPCVACGPEALSKGTAEQPAESAKQIIAICGSTRFIDEMSLLAWEYEKEGHIVFTCRLLPAGRPGLHGSYAPESHAAEAENVKELIDQAYFRKIEMSDRVVVYNKNGYIGESTRNEINHAIALRKPVSYCFDSTSGVEQPAPAADVLPDSCGPTCDRPEAEGEEGKAALAILEALHRNGIVLAHTRERVDPDARAVSIITEMILSRRPSIDPQSLSAERCMMILSLANHLGHTWQIDKGTNGIYAYGYRQYTIPEAQIFAAYYIEHGISGSEDVK